MNLRSILACLVPLLAVVAAADATDSDPRPRSFRPIEPLTGKAASPVAERALDPTHHSREAVKRGWTSFDRGDWSGAREWFLEALGHHPGNAEAAEGLVMTVYRGASARDAYELSRELEEKIPWLRRMVVEAVAGEVEGLLRRGESASAASLLETMPEEEKALEACRAQVRRQAREEGAPGTSRRGEEVEKRGDELPTAVEYALSRRD